MSKFDTDILTELLEQGATGNLGELMARSLQQQIKQETFVKSHRGLVLVAAWTLAVLSLAWLVSVALVVITFIGGLLTLVAWQTVGIFLGIALIASIVNFAIVKPIDKRVAPLFKTFTKLRKAEKEAKTQA